MSILKSNLSVTSDIFVKNKNEMLSKIDEIKKVKDFAFENLDVDVIVVLTANMLLYWNKDFDSSSNLFRQYHNR